MTKSSAKPNKHNNQNHKPCYEFCTVGIRWETKVRLPQSKEVVFDFKNRHLWFSEPVGDTRFLHRRVAKKSESVGDTRSSGGEKRSETLYFCIGELQKSRNRSETLNLTEARNQNRRRKIRIGGMQHRSTGRRREIRIGGSIDR